MNTEIFEKYLDSIYVDSAVYDKEFFYRWYHAVGQYYRSELSMKDDEIVGFLRKHPIDLAKVCKQCSDVKPEVYAARHWAYHIVPVTEEEGFGILDDLLTLQKKEFALDGSKDDFCFGEHFGLGAWIRNNWIHGFECDDEVVRERYDKCYKMLSGSQPMCFNLDSISDDFLQKYYDHLLGFVRVAKPVEVVRSKPSKCPYCGRKVLPVRYGSPGPEMMEAADRGEIILGGCLIRDDNPDYTCPCCGQSFRVYEGQHQAGKKWLS